MPLKHCIRSQISVGTPTMCQLDVVPSRKQSKDAGDSRFVHATMSNHSRLRMPGLIEIKDARLRAI